MKLKQSTEDDISVISSFQNIRPLNRLSVTVEPTLAEEIQKITTSPNLAHGIGVLLTNLERYEKAIKEGYVLKIRKRITKAEGQN